MHRHWGYCLLVFYVYSTKFLLFTLVVEKIHWLVILWEVTKKITESQNSVLKAIMSGWSNADLIPCKLTLPAFFLDCSWRSALREIFLLTCSSHLLSSSLEMLSWYLASSSLHHQFKTMCCLVPKVQMWTDLSGFTMIFLGICVSQSPPWIISLEDTLPIQSVIPHSEF